MFILAMSTEEIAQLISIGAIALLIIFAVIMITTKKNTWSTNMVVMAATCIALSFTLSFLKVSMNYGGAVTLASFVPLILFAYFFGWKKGLIAGLIYGLLQFIQSPWILNAFQFMFDYLFGFMSIALAGVFSKSLKQTPALLVGTICVGLTRLAFSTASGIMIFNSGWIVELPIFGNVNSAFFYSLAYNAIYIVPDITICAIVLFLLCKAKVVDRMEKMIKPQTFAKVSQGEDPTSLNSDSVEDTSANDSNKKNN